MAIQNMYYVGLEREEPSLPATSKQTYYLT